MKKILLGQVGDTEIRLLRVFKAVADCGGMAAAELELNIGCSTVSRHIKDLEERLGLVLCYRGRAGFALTAEGQKIYEATVHLIEALESFRLDVGDMHAELVGNLRLGIFDKTVTNPNALLDRAIRDFRCKAPEVKLDITVGAINSIENAVMSGQLHLGILPYHRRSSSLDYHELFSEEMYLYCGAEHPLYIADYTALTWETIQSYDYAGLSFHSPNMDAAHRFRLSRQASVSDQEAVATLILSGCYIGFLPEHYAALFVEQKLMRKIEHAECMYHVQFVAIQRCSPPPSRITQAFLNSLYVIHRKEVI
ncbi:MAG: LysR family transcriptional regulator [Pseudomonadota bacterium]